METKSLRDASIIAAQKTGLLPHEWLLLVMRGMPIVQTVEVTDEDGLSVFEEQDYYPTFEQRVDAAKACASFFAPKLAAQVVKVQGDPDAPLQYSRIELVAIP